MRLRGSIPKTFTSTNTNRQQSATAASQCINGTAPSFPNDTLIRSLPSPLNQMAKPSTLISFSFSKRLAPTHHHFSVAAAAAVDIRTSPFEAI